MTTQSHSSQRSSQKGRPSANSTQPRTPKDKAQTASGSQKDARPNNDTGSTPSEQERRKESSKLSQQALAAQKKAQELRKAANGAADPDERQHLMEEAIRNQIEAESFGKTAKYLQSGTFQGMAVGTGMGTVPGLTLGTLTGTLVGGTVSLVTGGLGGAMGAVTGAIHGPFWDMGKLAGKGIRKITGDLPGWKATSEQKAALEKMIGQVNEQDTASDAELTSMAGWEGRSQSGEETQTWMEQGASYLPSMSATEPKQSDRVANSSAKAKQKNTQASPEKAQSEGSKQRKPETTPDNAKEPSQAREHAIDLTSNTARAQPRRSVNASVESKNPRQGQESAVKAQEHSSKKKPRKLHQQRPSHLAESKQISSSQLRKKPRKLEVRSRQTD